MKSSVLCRRYNGQRLIKARMADTGSRLLPVQVSERGSSLVRQDIDGKDLSQVI